MVTINPCASYGLSASDGDARAGDGGRGSQSLFQKGLSFRLHKLSVWAGEKDSGKYPRLKQLFRTLFVLRFGRSIEVKNKRLGSSGGSGRRGIPRTMVSWLPPNSPK